MARVAAVVLLLAGMLPCGMVANAQEPPSEADALRQEAVAELMAQMDARDRVGQLFLVTFAGSIADAESAIADLILNYHIGGVLLRDTNDNITDEEDPVGQVAALDNQLQSHAFDISQTEEPLPPDETGDLHLSPFVPLFVAIAQEGDGYPYSRLHSGVTSVPNNMAIGATWNPAHAETVGNVVGGELAAIGVNMMLGPSLDVLDIPRPESPGGLGTRTFGGDPYWVGVMGQAYIRGVHQGSDDRVAVVAKHFPGHGGSDRQPDQEVSTVRRQLEQLKLVELAPFFAVTGHAPGPAETTDALLTSHIRYQGFQGNIRESTRPISFDPQALDTILRLPEFSTWRSAGGITVSDALGVRAVKRFYDPQLQEFPHRQIAQDAFLAGNDVLVLSEFSLTASYADHIANIKDTLDWFRDMYDTDVAFQTRVDQAVARILNLKLELYGDDFSLENVLVPVENLTERVGRARDKITLLAQDAITLIAPGPEELADRLPSPPNKSDTILIFTDERFSRQCTRCRARPLIATNALQSAILRLYGPEGTNQVAPGNLYSFSFQELEAFLLQPPAGPAPTPTTEAEATPEPPPLIQTALDRADWIIFAMLDILPDEPQSDAVKTFLSERPDLSQRYERNRVGL